MDTNKTQNLELLLDAPDFTTFLTVEAFKGCRMGRSEKVSLWYVSLLINTRFRLLYFRISNC